MRPNTDISSTHNPIKTWLQLLPFLTVGLYLLTSANFSYAEPLLWHTQQRIGEIAILVTVAVAVITRENQGFNVVSNKTYALIACLFCIGTASAALSEHPGWASLEISSLLLVMLLALHMANLSQLNAQINIHKILLIIITASTVVYSIRVAAALVATAIEELPLNSRDLIDGFSNRRFFSQYQVLTVFILTVPVFMAKTLRGKAAAFVLLSGWWCLSFIAAGRGMWIAALIGLIFLFSWSRIARNIAIIQIFGIISGFLLFALVLYICDTQTVGSVELFTRAAQADKSAGRSELFSLALGHAYNHPILGLGPMHFAAIENNVASHPHNIVLQFLSEWGLLAGLIVTLLIINCIHRIHASCLNTADHYSLENLLLVTAGASLISGFALSMVDGIHVMPYSRVLFATILGCWASIAFKGNRATRPAQKAIGIRLASIVSVLTLLIFTYPELSEIFNTARDPADNYTKFLLPRFWAQGWIQ